MAKIKIDLNIIEFQKNFFELEKKEQLALINVLKKIRKLTWDQVYIDKGLKWELIVSKRTSQGDRLYSFRFSQKYRAIALRETDYLRLLSLHRDHDSAYKH